MKQHLIDILKHNIGVILIGVAFLIFWFGGCGHNTNAPQNTHDTTTHTVQTLQPIVINPPYQPQQQGQTILPITIPQQYNASADIAKLTTQYQELVTKFLSLKRYSDSITLKDTAGNRVGVVNLDQTVSENTLKETKSSYQLYFPHTTTTITNTIYAPIKNQWFVGGTVTGPDMTFDLGLLLKNKKENILQLGVGYNFITGKPQAKVGYFQKIHIGK